MSTFLNRFLLLLILAASCNLAVHSAPIQSTRVNRNSTGDRLSRGMFGTSWIKADYRSLVTNEDKKCFLPVLKGFTVDKKLAVTGKSHGGIYTLKANWKKNPFDRKYKGHSPKNLILKVISHVDSYAFAEVKALKDVGEWVDSGMSQEASSSNQPVPVIIMVKKLGQVLTETDVFRQAADEKKKNMVQRTINLACQEVAGIATRSKPHRRILNIDIHSGNVLVTLDKTGNVISVEIVDWGRSYTVEDTVSENEVVECLFLLLPASDGGLMQ